MGCYYQIWVLKKFDVILFSWFCGWRKLENSFGSASPTLGLRVWFCGDHITHIWITLFLFKLNEIFNCILKTNLLKQVLKYRYRIVLKYKGPWETQPNHVWRQTCYELEKTIVLKILLKFHVTWTPHNLVFRKTSY